MQNRGALWIFTILLALACLWQLSFSLFTSRVEREAREQATFLADSVMAVPGNAMADRDSVLIVMENRVLRDRAEEKIYPVFGYSYRECKEKEINLGLDLKGGMAVTLEVSIPELVANLSENSNDATFQAVMTAAHARQSSSTEDFITLFANEWNKQAPNAKMAAVFHSADKKDMFPREASNDEIVEALRREAQTAINNTENILRNRIDKFGVAQPGIQKQQFSGRIQVELPGVKDKERVRKVLQSTANLEFWETLDNTDIGPILDQVNQPLSQLLYPELNKKDSSAVDSLGNPIDTATATAAVVDSTKKDSLVTDDSTAAPVDTALMRAEASKRAPLASKLMLMVGQRGWSRGPMVGQADLKDTAEVKRLLAMEAVTSALPADLRLAWGSKPQAVPLNNGTTGQMLSLYALKIPRDGKPRLDGSSISSASQDFDMKGSVEVRMSMNPEGAQIWALMTAENVGRSVAIVLDGLVYSAPEVRSEIRGGNSSIEMGSGNINKQIQEAEDLSNILKAGALPGPTTVSSMIRAGASLGEENVNTGLKSFLVALMLVMIYMVLYYARAGWVADLALLVNLFVLIGSLASLQAALTLPSPSA